LIIVRTPTPSKKTLGERDIILLSLPKSSLRGEGGVVLGRIEIGKALFKVLEGSLSGIG